MGSFEFSLLTLQTMGLIQIDYNQMIVKKTIEWADALYSRYCENIENAFVLLKLCGNTLVRQFYYMQEKQVFCIEFPERVDINSLGDEVLQTKQFDELRRNGYIVIKKY